MLKPTILVTGASGSIGASLIHKLRADNRYNIVTLGKNSDFNDYKVDLVKSESQEVVRKINPDYVVHLAGNPCIEQSFLDPIQDLKLNSVGTLNLLQGLSKEKKKVITFANSAAIYEPSKTYPLTEESPLSISSPYAVSKFAAESYIAQQSDSLGYDWTSLVISNSFGPSNTHKTGVISRIISAIKTNSQIKLSGKETRRDFIHVDDVCDAIIQSLLIPTNTRINISSMQEKSLFEIVSFIQKNIHTDFDPIWDTPSSKLSQRSCLDNSKAHKLIEWQPKIEFFPALKDIVINGLN